MGPTTQLTTTWTRRIERARDLATQHPTAADILRFYAEVLTFQGEVAKSISQQVDRSTSFREQIDYSLPLASFPGLLSMVQSYGPAPVAAAAINLERQNEAVWRNIFMTPSDESDFDWFFARACLQPIAENLQSQLLESTDQNARQCSVCGGLPQLVILRPEGEGARRSLLCSFCLREWAFRRVLCPYCGELDKEKLPTYTAEQCKHVRVEACDTCHHYLKSVDLSLDGLAVPLVDEVALAALDIWAAEHDYQKIVKNLSGF